MNPLSALCSFLVYNAVVCLSFSRPEISIPTQTIPSPTK